MRKHVVVVHSNDNVAIALEDFKKGMEVYVEEKKIKVVLLDDIPFGHKFAIKDIAVGEDVVKYGEVIGKASKLIKTGEHVHVHNVVSLRGRGDLAK